jgi:hypothetical protein
MALTKVKENPETENGRGRPYDGRRWPGEPVKVSHL